MVVVEYFQSLYRKLLLRCMGTDIDRETRSIDPCSEDANGDGHGDLGIRLTICGKVGSDKRLLSSSCSCHDGDSLRRFSMRCRGEQIAARPGLCDTSTMKICSVLRWM